jgi:hypothetical protein
VGSSIQVPASYGAGGGGPGGGSGTGFLLSYSGSFSRNGHNLYFTNALRGRYDPTCWLTYEVGAALTHLQAQQRTATFLHEYTVTGPGDVSLSAKIDIPGALKALSGRTVRPGKPEKKEVDSAEDLHVQVGLSLAAPTGKSTFSYADPATGTKVYYPPEAQLGSGIWRPGLSCTVYRRFGMFYPVGMMSYSYGRMLNPSGFLLSDSMTAGAGAMGIFSKNADFRVTALLASVFNVHDIRYRDRSTGKFETIKDSHGWLFFLSVETSVNVWKGLALEAGAVVPLGKTLEESPNDLDYVVKGGLRYQF